tara:strand:- start:693 stop:938 length:246 start_codon:yes stop_codon:yes gene_type:complete
MKDKLQEYIELNSKVKRMGSIMGTYRMEMNAESCKPLLDDGFSIADIIDYFTLELIDYCDNRYDDDVKKQNELDYAKEHVL